MISLKLKEWIWMNSYFDKNGIKTNNKNNNNDNDNDNDNIFRTKDWVQRNDWILTLTEIGNLAVDQI